jgi:hypothetical protein
MEELSQESQCLHRDLNGHLSNASYKSYSISQISQLLLTVLINNLSTMPIFGCLME